MGNKKDAASCKLAAGDESIEGRLSSGPSIAHPGQMSSPALLQSLALQFTTPEPGERRPDPVTLGDPSDFGGMASFVALLQAGVDPEAVKGYMTPELRAIIAATDPHAPQRHYVTWADIDKLLGEVVWDWQGWLPRGHLAMIVGSQEAGKSLVSLRLVGTYTMGWPWPDGTPFEGTPGRVVWAEGEVGHHLNISRAKAWGMDLSRIVTPHETIDDWCFDNPEHREALLDLMARPDVSLGIVDSLSGIHRSKESDATMQAIMAPFAEMARDTGKIIAVDHHLNKPIRGVPDILSLARVRGSGTITQTARVVIGIDRPDLYLPDTRRLRTLKMSWGPNPEPVGFTISNDGLTFCDAPEEAKKETQADKAGDLLLALLRSGPMRSTELQEEFEGAGISWKTAKRAKGKLGIVAVKKPDGWHWGLPTPESVQGTLYDD